MSEPDPQLTVQELIYAGLEAMRAAVPLDLCAYLQGRPGEAPQLFLGTPNLAAIQPNEAFTLFGALRDAVEGDGEGGPLALPGYSGIAVRSGEGDARGVHVAARKSVPLDEGEREVLGGIARAFGRALHALATLPTGATPRAPEVRRVAVEMVEGTAHARVDIAEGDEDTTGHASAHTGLRAVADATVDALDPALKTVEATEGDVGAVRAVLVVVMDGAGRSSIGARLLEENDDPLHAGARAAVDAVRAART